MRFLALALTTSAVISVSFLSGKALAAPFSLTTSPVLLNLSINPGTTQSTTLQVENNGQVPLQLSIGLDTFTASSQNGQVKLTPIDPSSPLNSYVHFSANTLKVAPGIWTPIKMTVDLPKQAELGYYFAVLFKPLLPTPTTNNGNVIKSSNAILVLVDTHSTNEYRTLSLSSFTTSSGLYEYLPTTFNVKVKNKGNIYLAPYGDIFISRTNNFTNPLADIQVNGSQGNVLPNTIRNFQAQWSDGFPVFKPKTVDGQPVLGKNGQTELQLSWDISKFNKFRIGKYYAHLALVYNDGKQNIPIDQTISFWVIPWKLITFAFLSLLAIIFGPHFFYRRKYKRSASRRTKTNL